MKILLEKAGDNPDQRPTAWIEGPSNQMGQIAVGEVFHIGGQPEDVMWRAVRFEPELVG